MEYNQILKKVALQNEVNVWLYMCVLMLIMTVKTTEGIKSYCSSPPVRNGAKATVTCYFDTDLSLVKNKVYLEHLGLNGESVETVVVCQWSRVHYTCDSLPEYKVVDNVSRQLSVEIPKALKEHSGEYRCTLASTSTGFQSCDLRVTIPSRVTRLTVNGQSTQISEVVQRNKSVSVVCSWENGDPPSTVRLVGSNGKRLLTRSDISGNIAYHISSAHCNDTDILHCEAAGSEKNLSTALLVECPPTFMSSTQVFYAESVNNSVKLDFPVRVHSMHFTKCQLIHYAEDFNLSEETHDMHIFVTYPCDVKYVNTSGNVGMTVPILRNSKCICHVNGILPDLIINIYIFNVTIYNSKRWRLMVSNSMGFEKIDFFLHHTKSEANITSLSIDEYEGERPLLVLRNRIVRINCSWDNVHPPTIVRLLNSAGHVLSYSANHRGNMVYTFPSVTCQDAGIFTCNAQGSKKNRSVMMLVECPPVFANSSYEMHLTAGRQDVLFNLSVRMHSPFITKCHISKFTSKLTEPEDNHFHNNYNTYMCKISPLVTITSGNLSQGSSCQCTVIGTAPDLVLRLVMFNVKMSDDGRWCVTLFNGVGSDHVDFFLHSINETITEDGVSVMMISTVIGGSAPLCIIVIIVVIVIRLKKGHMTCDKSIRRKRQTISVRETFNCHDDFNLEHVQGEVSTYEDIQDIEDSNESSSIRQSTAFQMDVSQADHYLQPVIIGTLESSINTDYIVPITTKTVQMESTETINMIYVA